MTEPEEILNIDERVELYRKLFKDSIAIEPVRDFMQVGFKLDKLEALEAIRGLNTRLSDLYMVSIPVITVWVRDSSYVPETGEIYLTEPDLEDFLHQFRHHLQNIERKYERRGLTAEGLDNQYYKIPYEKCMYRLRGEDDARAWAKFLIEMAIGEI
jgi:hypothetical protein